MPSVDQVVPRSAASSAGRRQAQLRVDVVQRAEDGAGRIDRPVRRTEPLHPAAFLVDQDRRIGLSIEFPQFTNKISYLRGRLDISLE